MSEFSPEVEAAKAAYREHLQSISVRKSDRAPKVTTDVHDGGVVQTIQHADGERQDILVQPKTKYFKMSLKEETA